MGSCDLRGIGVAMGRRYGLVVALWLLLAGCSRPAPGAGTGSCDYVDFIRFGGVTYEVADHGVGRPIARRDLGPVFARVAARAPATDCRDYSPRDGDAAALAPGAPVHTVKGYRPSFRLAAGRRGHLRLYEASEAAGARVGGDLLDLAGKVRYLSVNSGRVELARIKGQAQVGELVRRVLTAPVVPTRARAEVRYCHLVFNMADRTAVRRTLFPATGELMPGIQVPREFTDAVEGALSARQRTCGRGP
jgi:hypothetical protein